jgi:hypothetical protein
MINPRHDRSIRPLDFVAKEEDPQHWTPNLEPDDGTAGTDD